jgi:hypothetical protein
MHKYIVYVDGERFSRFAIGPFDTREEADTEKDLAMKSEPDFKAEVLELFRPDQVG